VSDEVVRYARASLKLFDEAVETTRGLVQRGVQPPTELDREFPEDTPA